MPERSALGCLRLKRCEMGRREFANSSLLCFFAPYFTCKSMLVLDSCNLVPILECTFDMVSFHRINKFVLRSKRF